MMNMFMMDLAALSDRNMTSSIDLFNARKCTHCDLLLDEEEEE